MLLYVPPHVGFHEIAALHLPANAACSDTAANSAPRRQGPHQGAAEASLGRHRAEVELAVRPDLPLIGAFVAVDPVAEAHGVLARNARGVRVEEIQDAAHVAGEEELAVATAQVLVPVRV